MSGVEKERIPLPKTAGVGTLPHFVAFN